ncbi:endonuclease [Clostridia bacterium]|nr:endonuclease [Clostridia bacterium]
MDFIDQVRQLATRVARLKDSIATEEATKMSLILPFFQALGYDVFNPIEFLPEFVADVGIKKGEKIDYAIMANDKPVILIECKWCGVALGKQDSQLFRYFGTSNAKFAILTNGIVYRFYTDLDEANKMDLTPFLELDLLNLKEGLVPEVKRFHKDAFDPESLMSAASELKYSKAIKDYLGEQLSSPSEDFIRFIVGHVYDGIKTVAVVERFTGIVKTSLNDFISERMNEKIKTALGATETVAQMDKPASETVNEQASDEHNQRNKIVTTAEELDAFYAIKNMFIGLVAPDLVTYVDTVSYFVVCLQGKSAKWICRLKMAGKKYYMTIFVSEGVSDSHTFDSINDLYGYKDELIAALRMRLTGKELADKPRHS